MSDYCRIFYYDKDRWIHLVSYHSRRAREIEIDIDKMLDHGKRVRLDIYSTINPIETLYSRFYIFYDPDKDQKLCIPILTCLPFRYHGSGIIEDQFGHRKSMFGGSDDCS